MTISLPIARYLAVLLLGLSLGTSPGWTADDERDDNPDLTVVLTLLVYRRDMPPCVRVATVGPDGAALRETAGRR